MSKVGSFLNPPQKCGIGHHYNALNVQTLQGVAEAIDAECGSSVK